MGTGTWVAGSALVAALVAVVVYVVDPFAYQGGMDERLYAPWTRPWDGPKLIPDLLTAEECAHIISLAEPSFASSSIVAAEGPAVTQPLRMSESAWIPKGDPVARKIFERALAELAQGTDALEVGMDHGENLQVVRYQPGAYFRVHHDSCCDDSDGCRLFVKDGGQRVATLLVYLNDGFGDGGTRFPEYNGGVIFKPPPGSGVFFKPLVSDGRCHPLAAHEGMQVTSGIKYVCNAWIRQNATIW